MLPGIAGNQRCSRQKIILQRMKFPAAVPLQQLAQLTGSRVMGDGSMTVTGINEIHKVEAGDITFVDHPKYYDKALNSNAGFVIINKEVDVPPGKPCFF